MTGYKKKINMAYKALALITEILATSLLPLLPSVHILVFLT